MIAILGWYLQDLIQLALSSALLAPEIFMIALNFCTIRKEKNSSFDAVCAVIGGLLYDLRWTAVPGLSGAIYVLDVWAMRFIWFRLPKDGRGPGIFTVFNALFCAGACLIRLACWSLGSSHASLMLVGMVQMALTVPVIMFFWLLQALHNDE